MKGEKKEKNCVCTLKFNVFVGYKRKRKENTIIRDFKYVTCNSFFFFL